MNKVKERRSFYAELRVLDDKKYATNRYFFKYKVLDDLFDYIKEVMKEENNYDFNNYALVVHPNKKDYDWCKRVWEDFKKKNPTKGGGNKNG